jgi:hypothetical protein
MMVMGSGLALRQFSRPDPNSDGPSAGGRICLTRRAFCCARLALALGAAVLFSSDPAISQELEARAYSASPIGANFLVLGIGRSSGNMLLIPRCP